MRLKMLLCALCAVVSLSASAAIPASEQAVAVEFYHAVLDHYFISADPKEINDLDTGVHKGWTRTGYRFSVIKGGSSYAGTSPVCRAFNPTATTHVYSAIKSECDDLKNDKYQGKWIYESDEVFRAFAVDPATGVCGTDTTPTFRLWNNREDSNHRYSDQVSVFVFMKGKNYIPEGNGNPALPVFFCTPSGGDVVPTASEAAPSCAVTANSSTPALNAPLNLSATCTNNPSLFMWVGCASTTASCTATKTTPGSQSYTLYAANAAAPADPVTITVNWGGGGGGGGAVPICSLTAPTTQSTVGSPVTLTASCNNSPATYEWMLCGATFGSPVDPTSPPACNINPNCAATSPTCAVTQSAAGPSRYAVDAKNSAGTGPKAYFDIAWTSAGTGGGGGGGGGPIVPVCSISSSNSTPSTGSTITLTATCSGNPTSYDWIGAGLVGTCTSSPTCQASWNVAQSVTYGVSGISGAGTGGRAYAGVNWTQTTPQPPACTLSASNSSPSVGTPITITSSCSNSPLSYTWKAGCTSTTSSCTDTSSTAGAKVYTMAATNAAGNSPDTSITVNWQPLPTAAPVCTVASSSGAINPYTNTNITLTATCSNSPASYAWTGCTSSGSTCTTTSANVGPVTYGVTATNVIGTSTPATVTVTWDKSTGGANFCGANTAYIDVPWGAAGPNGGRWLTSTNGGFPQGKVFVFSITVPAGTPHAASSQKFAMAEYQGPPAPRTLMLSENACDFPPSSTYLDGASGTAPLLEFNVGSGPGTAMQPGKTYYFSIRNDNCSQSSCDMSLSIPWH